MEFRLNLWFVFQGFSISLIMSNLLFFVPSFQLIVFPSFHSVLHINVRTGSLFLNTIISCYITAIGGSIIFQITSSNKIKNLKTEAKKFVMCLQLIFINFLSPHDSGVVIFDPIFHVSKFVRPVNFQGSENCRTETVF